MPHIDTEFQSQDLGNEDFHNLCKGDIHPMAIKGLEIFNKGHYWDAHEALEEAWKDEISPARHLYKGILQAGVTYLQIERGNFVGMAKMYERAKKWLAPWPPQCRGINVRKLKDDLEEAIQHAISLGPENLKDFDARLLKEIEYSV